MTILWSNNASTTVSGSITAASTSVQLAAGTGVLFPNPTGGNYYVATFYDQGTKTINEIVHVTAMAGDVATIVRAQEGTVARAWNAGDIFANLVTAGTLAAFVQAGTGPANTSIVYVGTDTSTTPGTIICATNPVPASLAVGMIFDIWVKNQNPGPVQLQFNGNAGIAATRTDGSAMVGGNLAAGENYLFMYNGVNFTSTIPPIPSVPPQTVFYVRTDGNDNNSGFANTPTGAFATPSGAINRIKQRYISQTGITIRVADGTYIDGIGDNTNYIASWSIIGNTTSPGNVVINATSVVQSSYPSAYASPARGIQSGGTAVMAVAGMTFQSYYENAAASGGGNLSVTTCNFTAPTSGVASPIGSYTAAHVSLWGNCSYTGAVSSPVLFGVYDGGSMLFAYTDAVATTTLTFNIISGTITTSTAYVAGAGNIVFYNNACTFIGITPNCPQYRASAGGGINFETGVTTGFPGTQPGIVTPPGWTA
jgi:hypothetical protein